jgi:hypothetical protein
MAVLNQTPFTPYTANGVTTVFPYTFQVLALGDLVVEVNGVAQVSGFTVSGIGNSTGGNVTFAAPPANLAKITLKRQIAFQRLTDYQDNGDLLADTVNLDYDRLWLALQQSKQDISRSLKLPFETVTDQTITQDAAARANKGVKFDALGNMSLTTFDPDNAELAAQAAQAALDSFDDRYLGPKATAPTTDNDGNALTTGCLYFNTTTGEMWVRTGSFWQKTNGTVTGQIGNANGATLDGWYELVSPFTNSGISGAPGKIFATAENGRIGHVGFFWNATFSVYVKMTRAFNGSTWTPWKNEIGSGDSASLASLALTHFDFGNVTGSADIVPLNGAFQRAQMTGNTTFAFNTLFVANATTIDVSLELQGAFTPTFTGVSWIGGSAPPYVAGTIYDFTIRKDAGGSQTIYGTTRSRGLGQEQTWQDVTGSRALATTYTNTTGRTISINAHFISSVATIALATVNGAPVRGGQNIATGSCFVQAEIPPGATYAVTSTNGGTISGLSWSELR